MPNARQRHAPLSAVLLAATLLVVAPAPARADAAADLEAIRAVGKTWKAHYIAGNFAAIPELYTEDTMVMPRGRPRIDGREQMRRAIGGLAAGRRIDIEVTEREAAVHGDIGWFIGDFRVIYTPRTAGEVARTEHGRSLVIFRRDADGQWRVHRDMDSPAPAPAAAAAVPTPASNSPATPAPAAMQSTAPALWDPAERTVATECDRLTASRYDRYRLAKPVAREDIDVPKAIAQCEKDLAANPGDTRLHFNLGRLYGYAGDTTRTLEHRRAAAAGGNTNAIFLLGYLALLSAKDDAARCTAAGEMRLAAGRGNYSAQVAYSLFALEGRFAACDGGPPADELAGYLKAAKPAVDGFFETLLVDHLTREAAARAAGAGEVAAAAP